MSQLFNKLLRTSKVQHVSFLLGSGFSIPDGYPPTTQINNCLKAINQNAIHIHTSGSAWFLNGQDDPNSWSKEEQKLFVQRFLEFYNNEIIAGEVFNYEKFYDFYCELRRTDKLSDKIKKFFDDFRKESGQEYDHYNFLLNFHDTFSQLLASLLSIKWPEPVSLVRPYQRNYSEFLELLDGLGNKYKVHIHSLNHDLLMERFAHTETLGNKLSDGFEEYGSPFYGYHTLYKKINNYDIEEPVAHYTVRLRKFTNEFSRQFCLYKLHGSIDQYVFNYENKEYTTIKLLYGISNHELFKEIKNDKGKLEYYRGHTEVYPDFLSGTLTKILNYYRQVYYKPIINHFVNNLINSQVLIVIGYGFGDSKINEIIENNFLSDLRKKMIVVDIKKNNESTH
jgi:hypothetical protein